MVKLTKFNVNIENCPKLSREEYQDIVNHLVSIQHILGDWCEINVEGLNWEK